MTSIVGGTSKLSSGFEIPLIGLGTSLIKDQEAITTSIDAALSAGYRLFDTAHMYDNEKQIGVALQETLPKHDLKRSDVFIITKINLKSDNNTEATREAVEESLKMLQTDYLDLVLIHYPRGWTKELRSDETITDDERIQDENPNNKIHRKDTYLELEKLKGEGKIKSVGVSNFEIRHMEELKGYATVPPAVNQCEFHPHFTRNELREYCKKENIFFQAYGSLARQEPALINEPVIVSLAEKHKVSVSLVLLAYAHVQGIGIIPKSMTPSRIHENLDCVNVKLTQEEVDKLTALNRNKYYRWATAWKVL